MPSPSKQALPTGALSAPQDLEIVARIAEGAARLEDTEGLLHLVADALKTRMPYKRLTLYILREGGVRIRAVEPRPEDDAVVVRLLETNTPPQDPLTAQISDLDAAHWEADRALGLEAPPFYVVPLSAGELRLGAFVVSPISEAPIDDDLALLLKIIALHLAIVVHRAERPPTIEALENTSIAGASRAERLQLLGELSAGVAHDFNNMLSAILGRSQMLKTHIGDKKLLRSVSVIERAALDSADTIRRIQEFASAKSRTDMRPIALNPLVSDLLERAEHRAQERLAGHLDTSFELGDESFVLGIPSELRQVITNLIYNAIDAMPDGGKLTLRTGIESEHDRVWVEVEDTGVGMSKETQTKIFSPFFTTKGAKGTGLGLSVSQGIVRQHGGELDVWSKRGHGTRIRVLLPRYAREAEPDAEDLHSVPPGELAQARVLVIDDDPAVREVLADILATGDHDVELAASGPEGLSLLGASSFDLVLTDLTMPDMNGWEVAEKIRQQGVGVAVGLITGWGASLDKSRLADRGIDLVVSKPFRYRQVLDQVAKALRLARKNAPKS